MPLVHSDTLIPHMFKHTPGCPQWSLVHLFVLGVSTCVMGMQGALHMFGHPHILGHLHSVQHLPHTSMLPICLYVLGGSVCDNSICWGFGVSAHLLGFWCLPVHPLDVHYASSCTLLHSLLCLKCLLPQLQLLQLQ